MWVHLCVLVLLILASPVAGFAQWMMKEFCHVDIMEGAMIMNEEAEVTADRSLFILRKVGDGKFVALKEKDTYIRGEQLIVKLSDTEGQFVFDVITKNADFVDGGCEYGERTDKNNAVLLMPHNEDEDAVRIQAAWALGHQKVRITSTITLLAEGSSGSLQTIKVYDSSKGSSHDLSVGGTGSGSATTGVASNNSEGASRSSRFFNSFVAVVYSMMWYIVGVAILFLVFALYRLNTKESRKMRGSKLS